MVPRNSEKGKCGVSYKGYGISVEEDEILETAGGDDGCTTIQIYLMSMICTLYNWLKWFLCYVFLYNNNNKNMYMNTSTCNTFSVLLSFLFLFPTPARRTTSLISIIISPGNQTVIYFFVCLASYIYLWDSSILFCSRSLLSIAEYNSIVWMYHNLFIFSPVFRHLIISFFLFCYYK